MADVFGDDLDKAEVFDSGTYFGPGKYRLKVKKVLMKQSYASGDLLTVEFDVVESDNPSHKPGSSGTWQQKMQPTTVSLPAIKGFASAIGGAKTKEEIAAFPAKAVMNKAISEGALNGKEVRAEFVTRTTKKNQKSIVVPRFSPV